MKKIDSISVKNGKVHAHLNWMLFEDSEKGIFVGLIPTLKIAAHTKDVDSLSVVLNQMVKRFFEFYSGKKLERELSREGWNNFNPPEDIKVPIRVMYGKTKIKELEFNCQ